VTASSHAGTVGLTPIFFNVEERRSKNAGREFWNHRRMLGRVAISDLNNPNLKDKAGREGIIDNRASKVFRAIVINILTTSARLYFGSASKIRKEKLPELQEAYGNKQKEQERERILQQKRRQFRTRLEANYPAVIETAFGPYCRVQAAGGPSQQFIKQRSL